uniref:Ig-like domain-containing protein n=1 Tax=Cyprinus carpio TaxID=7962 RepID=A0A8C2DUY2_CYPCA
MSVSVSLLMCMCVYRLQVSKQMSRRGDIPVNSLISTQEKGSTADQPRGHSHLVFHWVKCNADLTREKKSISFLKLGIRVEHYFKMQEGSLCPTTSFRIFYLRLLGFCFLYFSSVAGTQAECPVQLSQQRVVVRYNGSVAVNCNTSITHKGMGWEASEGGVPMTRDKMITWRVSHLTEWDIEPFCYINHEEQCQVQLLVTIYKTPDSVSISIVDHSGPMIEGQQYELQCDVHDVAPVQYLTVKWYKGQTLINQNTFTEDSKTPGNKTATLQIRPDRADDGAQYSCAAELELGAEGPQPPPNKTSESLSFTVYSKPIIDENKLPSIVPVFRGNPEVLVCEAEGNPKPTISWILGTNVIVYNETLTISESTPEHVYCIADNSAGRTTRQVNVSIQAKPIIDENKLPSIVPVFRGNPEVLVCEAEGNPKPTISWILGTNVIVYNETLTISESTPEHVYCMANNSVGSTTRQVNVSIQDISISTVSHTGPMIAGEWYELQCFIQNVVFKIVDVRWYKLNQINVTETIKTPANLTYKVRIRPDRADDGAQFWCEAKLEAKGPQRYSTMSSDHLSITVHSKPIIDENKLPSIVPVFRGNPEVLVCEAEGNPKPTISWILGTNVIVYNESLTISESTPEHVYCIANNSAGRTTRQVNVSIQVKPIINENKLPSIVPVFRGYPEVLVCEAEGHPKPTISWILGTNVIVYNETLTISESTPEHVYCVANNSAGRTTRQVNVVLKEDYLPLIAGLIAVTVVFISVIFIFIYSIYYKTAKMGRYSLKDAKPSAQNGNIAQNGKHSPIPMKKLSQSDILA